MGGKASTISNSEERVAGIRLQTSSFGFPLPIVYGRSRLACNLMWYGDFVATAVTEKTSSGGKGGGGVKQENTSYTYTAAVMFGLCEGPIADVTTVWAGKKVTTVTDLGLTKFLGAYPQSTWTHLTTNHPTEAISYQGVAHLDHATYPLGNSANLPDHTFEINGRLSYNPAGNLWDAEPSDIVTDFLTNANYGAGFPPSRIADLTQFRQYCVASNFLVSPVYNEQKPAQQHLQDLCDSVVAAIVWSEGKLKIIPYQDQAVTGNGVTFTPSITPVYDLTDDDFLYDSSEDPIVVSRKTQADAYNHIQIEFINRDNQYNIEIAEAKDQANIEQFGLRSKDAVKIHSIAKASVARQVAQLMLQRALYIRNTYAFKLGYRFAALEPMDIVTITDSALGLDHFQVRITEVEEDENGNISINAEEFPFGVASSPLYSTQDTTAFSFNYNSAPGNSNAPVFLEAPLQISGGGLEVWIAVSGGSNWGGAEVWVSRDNATYQRLGNVISGARTGTASVVSGSDPDVTHTMSVDLTESRGQLLSGTQADADALTTLCTIGGELVSYETANLTAPYKYDVTYLRRGVYDTPIGAHAAGTRFARVDQSVIKFPYSAADLGATIWLKFVSFNPFGGGRQDIAGLTPYLYTITGSPLAGDLADVTGLTSNYIAGTTFIRWDAVVDALRPVKYEIRKGTSWESGQVVAITPVTYWPALGDGEYWVAARSDVAGITAYSNTPVSVTIVGTLITSNIIATFDEAASGWTGTRSSEVIIISNELALRGAGDILAAPDILALTDVLYYGGVEAEGTYEVPAGHVVNVGRVVPCNILVTYTAFGQSLTEDFYAISDLYAQTDLYNAALGQFVSVTPQVAIAGADAVFGPWQNYAPGAYSGQYFKSRLVIDSLDPTVQPRVSAYTFAVDVPDRTEAGTNVTVGTGGLTVTYTTPFNGGPGAAASPNVQVTILNASAGDDVVLNPSTTTGFTVVVKNGGSNVSRNINWIARGY